MTCGSKCTCKKEEWNNGTIYRIFVQRDINATSNIIDVPVDIAQGELTGKVFIGVENFCLDRKLADLPPLEWSLAKLTAQSAQSVKDWSEVQYMQLRSINLPPDIDWTAAEANDVGQNSHIFARLPLDLDYKINESLGSNFFALNPRVTGSFPLNKDGILYEMTNNPNALSNGRLRIQLLDDDGPWNLTRYPIYNLAFTIVIYKPRNTYN